MKKTVIILLFLSITIACADFIPSVSVLDSIELEDEISKRIELIKKGKLVSISFSGGEEFPNIVTINKEGNGFVFEVAISHQRVLNFGSVASKGVYLPTFPSGIEDGNVLSYSFSLDRGKLMGLYLVEGGYVSMCSYGMKSIEGDELVWVVNYLRFVFPTKGDLKSFVKAVAPLLAESKDAKNSIEVGYSRRSGSRQ